MYPFIRMTKEIFVSRNDPPLDACGEHVSHHLCWPWDLDLWNELNNGRTLTLYDLGRIPLARRTGLWPLLRREGWGMAMAGAVVRYRKRIKLLDRIEMRSRLIGWDAKFLYIEQSMWKSNGDCASHALYRGAITDRNGIVSATKVMAGLGQHGPSPELPHWVRLWIETEAARPWPPMQEEVPPVQARHLEAVGQR